MSPEPMAVRTAPPAIQGTAWPVAEMAWPAMITHSAVKSELLPELDIEPPIRLTD
jgi:hypothetical protein